MQASTLWRLIPSGVAKGESGARALGRRPWGRISTLLQSFKSVFLAEI